jgi:hypothetical protein
MMLRKFMGAKNLESRILAIHGLTIVLLNYVHNEKHQLEILTALSPAFSFPIEIREHLYHAVSMVLEQFRDQEKPKVEISLKFLSFLGDFE